MRRTTLLLGAGAATAAGLAVLARRRTDDAPLETVEGGHHTKVETSDGAVLDVHVAGDGPVVLLPHCWGGSMETWAPVAARLVASGHRVVRYDQRGHGGSTVGTDGFGMERFGADVREVIEALDLRDLVIAGHSLGGMSTQAFAIHHRDVFAERVRALVLVATASAGLGRLPLVRSGTYFVGAPWVQRAVRGRGGTMMVRGALGKGAARAAVSATRDLFVATTPDVRRGILSEMLAMDLRDGRRTIAVPTTVVSGTRDTLTPPRYVRDIADAIPGARFVSVPGGGHMLPYEVPDLLVRLIAEAAERAEPAAA